MVMLKTFFDKYEYDFHKLIILPTLDHMATDLSLAARTKHKYLFVHCVRVNFGNKLCFLS
jgi:hypothetical protein